MSEEARDLLRAVQTRIAQYQIDISEKFVTRNPQAFSVEQLELVSEMERLNNFVEVFREYQEMTQQDNIVVADTATINHNAV